MTRTRAAAHAWTTITVVLIAAAIYATAHASWWCLVPLLTAGTPGMLAAGCYHADRHDQRIARTVERQNRNPGPIPPPRPCCRFWQVTDGRVHDRTACTRPPAARTSLTAADEQTFAELTRQLRKDRA